MKRRIYAAQEIEDTLESYLGGGDGSGRLVYVCVMTVIAAVLTALPLVRVEVTVSAPGVLRPMLERHEVRSLVSGTVAEVGARLDAEVRAGQTILRLNPDELDLRREVARRRRAGGLEVISDLRRLLVSESFEEVAAAPLSSQPMQAEREELLGRWREQELRIGRTEAETARVAWLAGRGLVPLREAERMETDLALARQAGIQLMASQHARWLEELERRELEASDLDADLSRLAMEARHLSVAAPVAGTLEEMRVLSPGSMVQAGEVIAVVSPEASLVAEALVSPRDVGRVEIDQRVRLHVDAFDFREWGHLEGRVVSISRDYVLVGDVPRFRAGIAIDPRSLRLADGTLAELRKGMTLQARFRLGERSLLQILRGDVSEWLHPWENEESATGGRV